MWSAWLGLAGVLVGAFITGGFSLWVTWRNERADAAAESKRHDAEVRRAARLIDDDLRDAADAARWCTDHKFFPVPELTTLATPGWQQHRDVIAPELSDIAWRSFTVAVGSIDGLRLLRAAHTNLHRTLMAVDPQTAAMVETAIANDLDIFGPAPVTDEAVAQTQFLLKGLELGRAALAPLMKDKPKG